MSPNSDDHDPCIWITAWMSVQIGGEYNKSSTTRKRLRQECIGTHPPKLIARPVMKQGRNGPMRVRQATKKWSKDETNCLEQAVRRQVQALL